MTGAFSPSFRAALSGSTVARRAASNAALPNSRNGATRCWRKRNATSTSSTAKSSPKSTGCATASPARRKRNMRRVGQLQALREQRRTYRATAGNATITASSAAPSGAQVIEAAGISKSYDGPRDRARLLDPHPARRPHRHRRAERQRQDHADQHADRRCCRRICGSVRLGSTLAIATLSQHRDSLDPNVTVTEALTGGRGDTRDGQRTVPSMSSAT